VYSIHHDQRQQQYGRAWCILFTTTNANSSMDVPGVSLFTASRVPLSTTISMDVQGTSFYQQQC
jgi:hypothetical protein